MWVGTCYKCFRMHVSLLVENLRCIREMFLGVWHQLSMLDPLQTSCWFMLSKASYFPTGEETLAQAVGCIWCEM